MERERGEEEEDDYDDDDEEEEEEWRTGAEKNSTSAVVNYLGKSESLPRGRFGLEARGVNLRPAGIIHLREV